MSNKSKVLDQLRGGETVITVIAEKSGLTEDQVRNAIRGLQQFDDMNISFVPVKIYTVKLTEEATA